MSIPTTHADCGYNKINNDKFWCLQRCLVEKTTAFSHPLNMYKFSVLYNTKYYMLI